MKVILRRGLTTLMCVGTLIVGTQSWAGDSKTVLATSADVKTTVKTQEQCSKPCKMMGDEKAQNDEHKQHQHGNSSEMSQMDHSKMTNMDHSMMNMDHSKMNMSGTTNK